MNTKNILSALLLSAIIFIASAPSYAGSGDCNPVDFNTAPTYLAGMNITSYTTSDFNGDGKLDIATANSERAFSVIFGDGDAGFGPPVVYPVTDWVGRITSADLNSDGKPDIVIGMATINRFLIYLNNGAGGFGAAPVIYNLPGNLQPEFYDLKSGDFNGDGKADLVTVQRQTGKKLRYFLGDGAGGLTAGTTIDINISGTEATIGLGNIDGDATTDVFVSSGRDPRSISWVLGRTDGNFSLTFGFNVEDRPSAIRVADLNNDSVNDIAVAFEDTSTPTEHYLRPYLNIGGAFTPQPKISLTYSLNPYDLTVGDFNGDGKKDLAAMIENGLIVTEYGRGDGTFTDERLWTVPEGNFIFAHDANADSRVDLISIQGRSILDNMISVVLNDNLQGFKAPKPIFFGESMIDSGDLNNDDLLDMVTASQSSFASGSYIAYALNDGDRSFLPALTVDNGANGLNSIKTGDFNGDGHLDAVTAHGNNSRVITVYPGNGTGTLQAGITSSLNIISVEIAVGDFNGDGKDDLFAISESGQGYSLLATGTGTFTIAPNFPVTVETGGFSGAISKGDFNGDSKVDILTSANNGNLKLYAGAGNGQFSLLSSNMAVLKSAVPADLNGDGKLDIAGIPTGIFVPASVSGILGDGAGGFGTPFTLLIPNVFDLRKLIAGDFNNDGLDDVAITMNVANRPGLAIVPSAAASATPSWKTPTYYNVGGSPNITAADFDNDGKTDIGFTNGISRAVLYNTTGSKPCISIIGDTTVTEGDSGTTMANFPVSLSAASKQTVRVNYTVEVQTATAGTDVQLVSGRLEIPAGQTSAMISIPVTGDLLDEFDETFKVNLSGATNAVLERTSSIGTIIDNDAEPTLTITNSAANENASSASFTLTVNLSAPSGKPISFRYAMADGTATGGRDYPMLNGLTNIAAGATTTTIGVLVTNENIHELDENFFVNLTEPVNVTISDGQGEVVIRNDDAVPTVAFNFNSIQEGDTGSNSVNHTFGLSNPTYRPVTISYNSVDVTATGGTDYVVANGSVVIPAEQQQSPSIVLQSIGDTINEPNETFNLVLSTTNLGPTPPNPVLVTVIDDEFIANDFDLDGKTDLTVFRPSDQTWYTLFSSNGGYTGTRYGLSTDIPVSGDYNGDGRSDIAVWRPSNGTWYNRIPGLSIAWGMEGDIPVHGDYDNDGRIDVGVFRPSDSTWYIRLSSDGSFKFVQFGLGTDKPVPADYDGDGKTDIAVFRPSDSTWYIRPSTTEGFYALFFGLPDDIPVPADYTGDGKADIAVFREGQWHVYQSNDNQVLSFHWGQAGDKPVPGNYDGDAKTDFAIYRNGTWWIYLSSTATFISTPFGLPDDVPLPFVSNR